MNEMQKEALKYTTVSTLKAIGVGILAVGSVLIVGRVLVKSGVTPDGAIAIIASAGLAWFIASIIYSVYQSKVRELEWTAGAAQREAERAAERKKDAEWRANLLKKI